MQYMEVSAAADLAILMCPNRITDGEWACALRMELSYQSLNDGEEHHTSITLSNASLSLELQNSSAAATISFIFSFSSNSCHHGQQGAPGCFSFSGPGQLQGRAAASFVL